MSLRRYALPLTTLNLVVSAGCTEVGVGDWLMEELEIDGEVYDLSYGDGDYLYELSGALSVESDLSVEFTMTYTYTDKTENHTYQYRYRYEGEATTAAKNEYAIEVEGDDQDLDFECTVEGDTMECEGESSDDSEYVIVFERDE